MIDLAAIRTRRFKDRDARAVQKLTKSGRQYVEPCDYYSREDSIVAEIPTLTPIVVGVLGWFVIKTVKKLLPNLYVATISTDPYLSESDSDAVAISLIRAMYGGFAEVGRGYLKTRVDVNDSITRGILEAEDWKAMTGSDDSNSVAYVWFAERYFKGPGDPLAD